MRLSKIFIKITALFRNNPNSSVSEAAKELRVSQSTASRHRAQRDSSAVEERNGYLAQDYHNCRGLSKRRLQTFIHNFLLKRSDGTTSAQRFYRLVFQIFGNLFFYDG